MKISKIFGASVLLVAAFWLSIFSQTVSASVFQLPSSNKSTKVISQSDSNVDILVPALGNNGVSFNLFTDFKITGRKLVIYNDSRRLDSRGESEIARVIIIESPNIQLSEQIEILGSPADILFVTRASNKTLSCNDCSFGNVGRVTMAVAGFNVASSIVSDGVVGNLTTLPGGVIEVSNLSAPGAQSLEFIGDSILTSGNIDINLRADIHQNGGYIVSPKGASIVGAGGISIYKGRMSVRYQDLQVIDVEPTTGELSIAGNLRATTIGIVSSNAINIAKNAGLSTLSDMIATSNRESGLYVPIEGIYIQTLSRDTNSGPSVIVNGKLASDGSVSVKSLKNIDLLSPVVTNELTLISKGDILNKGHVQAALVDISSNKLINNGVISASKVNVDTDKSIFNSFGGQIKANDVVLKSRNGFVVNGSRTQYMSFPDLPSVLPISTNITSLTQGVYYDLAESGSIGSNLSAHISANRLSIDAKAFENINPYSIVKPSSADWSSGIIVNNQLSSQVSIQAENKLEIKASSYVLNSSAIIGLNQGGTLVVNSPKLSNERYRMQMESYVYNQTVMSSSKSREFDSAKVGTTTKVIAYSPPARFYSFGEFRFSDGNDADVIDEEFINELSYFEVFADAHFHQTEIKTIGLEVSEEYDYSSLYDVRNCLMYRTCDGEHVTTLAEAETLFSVSGNVYGLDKSIASQTDLEVANINVRQAKEIEVIQRYLAPFFYQNDDHDYGTVKHSEVQGDMLTGERVICKKKVYKGWGANAVYSDCEVKAFQVSITWLLSEEAKDRELGNTGYTPAQFDEASRKYVDSLPTKAVIWTDPQKQSFYNVSSVLEYISYSVDGCYVVVGYQQDNTFYGYNHVPYSYTEAKSYSSRIPINTLMAYLSDVQESNACSLETENPVPKTYTDTQYNDAARVYISTLPVDSSLWSISFKQVKNGDVGGTTSNKITYISYSLNGTEVLVNYEQVDYYTVNIPYVGTRSFSEPHALTKRISVTELMNYLPN
ncbi:hypothetical protein LZP73_13295 [Shewanella sp. AS16]|uniref:hypothetical protein n=1 Tax=Shewanella sp. AS16 TaxID=2907625 RepID=UPI001F25FB9B|nr:hypothetical protein [Shewanella sp. AS16]MCE9687168.1 hypothetical protein [Shewanella sp. AS16]